MAHLAVSPGKHFAMKKLSAVLTRSKRKILEYKDATETATSSQLEQMRHLEELSKPLIPDNYTMTSGCLSESIDEQTQKQLQLDAWVQCENPDCLKWRRLSQEAAAQLNGDSPWFCFLNQDPNYCSCDDPEEDYRQLEHMAKKLGLKYVASTLQEGTLVWAKMAGYCRWPAIITRDPYDGLHVMEASGGDPQSYHVEFLGQPHSHGWVASRMVDLYGSVDKQSPTKIRMTRSFGRIGTGRKTNVWKPKERTVYKSVTIATAEAEAAQFVDITPLERLASSVFKYVEQSQSQKDSEEVLLDHKEYPNEKARSKQDTHQKKRIKGTVSIKKVEIEDNQTQRLLSPKQGDVYDFSNQGSPMNRLEMKSRLKCSTPLAGKTKEQKFALDIEMYRRNAKAFEHDVQRFMARSGTRIHRMPCWQNTPVSLFQIFLAVHERGGFQNVGRHRGGWAGVYQEVTSISNACYGNVAKNYYMVNLLPYEMYLAGEDYSLYIHGRKRKKIKLQNSNDAEREINQNNVEYVNLQLKQQMQSELDGEDMSSQSDDHKEESSMELRGSEIEQLLHKLDTCGDQCTLNDVDQTAEDARPDIEVTFYDESPNQKKICLKEADTASEFGQADMPEGAIQEVPDVIYTSDEEPEEDEDEQVLHEMQALQEELDEMNQEVAQAHQHEI